MSIRTGVLLEVREAIPAIVALAAALAASALLDGWSLVVVLAIIVAGMFAAFAYRDRSARGIDRGRARERFAAQLDRTELRARDGARLGPLVVAIALATIDGFDARVFALASLAGFLAAQLLLGLWLHARRRARSIPPPA